MKRLRDLTPVAEQNTQRPLYFGKLLNLAMSTTFSIMVLPEVDGLLSLLLHWSLLFALDYFSFLPTF